MLENAVKMRWDWLLKKPTELRREMIMIKNKSGDPPVSWEESDSYSEGFDRSKLQKVGKDKSENSH